MPELSDELDQPLVDVGVGVSVGVGVGFHPTWKKIGKNFFSKESKMSRTDFFYDKKVLEINLKGEILNGEYLLGVIWILEYCHLLTKLASITN